MTTRDLDSTILNAMLPVATEWFKRGFAWSYMLGTQQGVTVARRDALKEFDRQTAKLANFYDNEDETYANSFVAGALIVSGETVR